jgi:hypothetical protein
MATAHRHTPASRHSKSTAGTRRWSRHVAETSDALDIDRGVFTRQEPTSIARSLKRSAERSRRRKADPFRSAMSMLVFYINRAGKTLGKRQRAVLERAKEELRRQFHRPTRSPKHASRTP